MKVIISVLAQYGIKPDDLVSVASNVDRHVWRVTDSTGDYALKFVKSHNKANRIVAVNEYLHQKGLPVVKVIPTKEGSSLVRTERGSFLLFPWLEGEQASCQTPGMIERAAVLLARFHEASRGYVATGGPITELRFDLIDFYQTKLNEMDRLREMAHQMDDPFTKRFLDEFLWLRSCITWVLERLPHTSLRELMAVSRHDPMLAHGDYSLQNLLLRGDELTIIDLDLVSIALPVIDISHFITWLSHELGLWSMDNMKRVLSAYQQVRPLSPKEQELILVNQVFPHKALRLGIEHIERKHTDNSLQKLERCLKTDREKIAALGLALR